jgi:16S rRNA (uracil1498-N3)-methyltransferase
VEPAGKAHAFVSDLAAPELDERDRHHLERVLRLRAGDELTVSDGRGRWRLCRLGPELDPIGPVNIDAAAEPPVTVAFALVKGDRNEWIVQKLTELGVDRIVPLAAERCVVQWDAAKAIRNRDRLEVVAREAAMQSRRTHLPTVEPLTDFAAVVTRPGAVLADRAGSPPILARPLVLVGPEGGWSDQERAASAPRMTLGPTVLRSETAAIVAGAALCGLRSALFASEIHHGG